MYCEKCKSFTDLNRCPNCGNKNVREAKENDVVYLTTMRGFFAGMLEDILAQNDIPCLKIRQGPGGTFPTRGQSSLGEYRFFIPFGAYERAKEIFDEFFKGSEE